MFIKGIYIVYTALKGIKRCAGDLSPVFLFFFENQKTGSKEALVLGSSGITTQNCAVLRDF